MKNWGVAFVYKDNEDQVFFLLFFAEYLIVWYMIRFVEDLALCEESIISIGFVTQAVNSYAWTIRETIRDQITAKELESSCHERGLDV